MMDELVKRLREFASLPEHCENVADCDKCSKEEICLSFTNKRIFEVATQAADAIEELSAIREEQKAEIILMAAEDKPRWIPVTERLPEENGYYLTYVESAIFPNSYYLNMIKFIDGNFVEDHCVIHRVTHWMPLPEAPKEER